MEKNEIEINGIKYVKADSVQQTKPENRDDCEWCMVRTDSAGVFFGLYNTSTEGKEGVVYQARRIYYWNGAATLSQLATDGTSKPNQCKFPAIVDKVLLKEIIEVIPMTNKAKESLDKVSVWSE